MQAVGNGFTDAYLPIVEKRKALPWGERERQFQLYRRGRYVDSIWCGIAVLCLLQTGGRTESICVDATAVRWDTVISQRREAGSRAVQRFLRTRLAKECEKY